jgi:hypothetical protein
MHVGSNAFDAMDNGSWFVTSRNGVRGDAGSIQVFKRVMENTVTGGMSPHWSPSLGLTFLKALPSGGCMYGFTYVFPRASAQFVERDAGYPVSLLPWAQSRTDYGPGKRTLLDGKNFVALVTLEMHGHLFPHA